MTERTEDGAGAQQRPGEISEMSPEERTKRLNAKAARAPASRSPASREHQAVTHHQLAPPSRGSD